MVILATDAALSATPFEELKNLVLPRLPNAVPDHVEVEMKSVLREFFNTTTIWRGVIGPYTVRAGRQDVPLDPVDASTDVSQVMRVWYNDTELTPIINFTDKAETTDKTPQHYATPEPGVVYLWPTPDTTVSKVLTIYGALVPARDFLNLPSFALTHWQRVLEDGILGRMYSQPVKPYTNPTLAQYHLARFRSGMAEARRYAEKGGQRRTLNWSFPMRGFA